MSFRWHIIVTEYYSNLFFLTALGMCVLCYILWTIKILFLYKLMNLHADNLSLFVALVWRVCVCVCVDICVCYKYSLQPIQTQTDLGALECVHM